MLRTRVLLVKKGSTVYSTQSESDANCEVVAKELTLDVFIVALKWVRALITPLVVGTLCV